ncbi:hypothetical protein GCM10027418_09520 [Mariniluteicoccus endophyticus]
MRGLDRVKWRRVLAIFLVAKVAALLVAAVAVPVMELPRQQLGSSVWPDETHEENFNPVTAVTHFDSEHYIALVDRDYLAPLDDDERQAIERARAGEEFSVSSTLHRFTFGPMYPLLGKVLAPVLGAPLALWLVAQAAMIVALALMYDLTRLVFGEGLDPTEAITWLVVLPSGFLLQAVLTESLFVACVLGAFVLAERRQWLWAIIPGLMLGLTRSSGFLMCLPLLLVWARQVGWWPTSREQWALTLRAVPGVAAPAIAWGGFMAYCFAMTGDWFAYPHLQHAGWGVTSGPPLGLVDGLFDYGRPFVKAWSVVLMAAILLAGVRLLPASYQVLGWILLVVPLMIGDNWQQSIWRYAVEVFPVAWIAAHWLRDRVRQIAMTVSAALQGVLLLAWTSAWTRMIV